MLKKTLIFILFGWNSLYATEQFTLESIKQYLTQENPYIYSALAKKYLTQEKVNYAKGAYDTTLTAKYDEKEYPYSDGTYYGASLEKPTEIGVDLSAGYRYAYGTQEYNNIKTGKNGEFLVAAHVPLISFVNQIDARRLALGLSQINLKKTDFEFKEAMRNFYFSIMSEYYTLLQSRELLQLSKELLEKVQKRELFLQTHVSKGNLAKIVLLEARQQVIHAKQNYLSRQRVYENQFTEFLKHLNLSKEKFHASYHLPSLPAIQQKSFHLEDSFALALKHRPDLKMLETEIEKLLLKNKNNERKKYPQVDLGLYGVYDVDDIEDRSGFKLSLNISLPLARNQYSSKNAEIKESIKIVNNDKQIRLLELKTDLEKIINSLHTVLVNIKNAKEESTLLLQLEEAEKRKYKLGASTLFLLNQRETLTMQARKKILEYKLEYQLLYQAYKRIISLHALEG